MGRSFTAQAETEQLTEAVERDRAEGGGHIRTHDRRALLNPLCVVNPLLPQSFIYKVKDEGQVAFPAL